MQPRRLVYAVFEHGSAPRIPVHVESDDKDEEYRFGDVVGVGARIGRWRSFYEEGGPFRMRPGERLAEWADRVDPASYEWPEVSSAVSEAVEGFVRTASKYGGLRFVVFKVLGPTETAESFFAYPSPGGGDIAHGFGFALLLKVRPGKAYELYDRISRYVLELVKCGAELDFVDGVRVADDVADYKGLIYPRSFYEERYLRWHRAFAEAVRRRGKVPIMHNDGDLVRAGVIGDLSRAYRGLHPLDLRPKSTVAGALEWASAVAEARRECESDTVFFTGIPVDLLFNDGVSAAELVRVVKELLRRHGAERLVLATTHSPYPGRSYGEPSVRSKLEAVLRLAARPPGTGL